jgi:hypothetical protein
VSATVERPEVAVVRHPIADRRNNVVGYELRFGGAVDLGDPSRDAKATSALLVEAFGDIGLERLAGRHPAWVSIARNFLVEIGPPPVRPAARCCRSRPTRQPTIFFRCCSSSRARGTRWR